MVRKIADAVGTPTPCGLSNVSTADFSEVPASLGIEVHGQSRRLVLPSMKVPAHSLFQNILLVSSLNPISWQDGELSQTPKQHEIMDLSRSTQKFYGEMHHLQPPHPGGTDHLKRR
jgi:hypothetical protein